MIVLARLFAVLFFLLPAQAASGMPELPDGLALLGEARVAAVSDGDTVTLDDGSQVRLVGIMAPRLPLGRAGFRPWPWAAEAKAGLEDMVLGKTVLLWGGQTTRDRHGRILAHLVRQEDGLWVQGAMLRDGFARVYSFADNRMAVPAMYAIEKSARAAGRGLWSHPRYAVVPAAGAERAVRSFAIVEGHVRAVAEVGSRVYLNYGEDWREDFTVKAERKAVRLFREQGLDLTAFQGRLIRVRGWIKWENGPLIEATHPEQIEILDEYLETRSQNGAEEVLEP